MQAHPMILPHEARDSPNLSQLSNNARKVYSVLYDMVDGYASPPPVWKVTRYIVNIDGAVFGNEEATLIQPGWRSVTLLRNIPQNKTYLPPAEEIPESSAQIVSYTSSAVSPAKMTIGDFILHMEKHGLGRPSTYANHAQKLINEGLIVSANNVTLSDKGRSMLNALRNTAAARFNADFTRSFLADLDSIDNGKLSIQECFSRWLSPSHASQAANWLQRQHIEGDYATVFYEARDDSERLSVPWTAGTLPREIDPEMNLPADSTYREYRKWLNNEAASRTKNWIALTQEERISMRIVVDAEKLDLTEKAWRDKYAFDLLRRWLVGWSVSQ